MPCMIKFSFTYLSTIWNQSEDPMWILSWWCYLSASEMCHTTQTSLAPGVHPTPPPPSVTSSQTVLHSWGWLVDRVMMLLSPPHKIHTSLITMHTNIRLPRGPPLPRTSVTGSPTVLHSWSLNTSLHDQKHNHHKHQAGSPRPGGTNHDTISFPQSSNPLHST